MDGLWVIMLLSLIFSDKSNDGNGVNYLDNYKKYGDDEKCITI